MPDLSGPAEALRSSLGGPLAVVAGLLLLLFGRRLYWLLAGVVGFVVVFTLSGRLLPEVAEETMLWASLLCGVAGAVLAVVAHRFLLSVVGGLGGVLIALWQVQQLGVERGVGWLVAAIVGGVLGAWLLSRLFEVALAVLSSLLGAQLLVDRLPVPSEWLLVAYLGLAAFGFFFQLLRSRRRRRNRSE
jgi:hypothetical protein